MWEMGGRLPIGIAEYDLTKAIREEFKSNLLTSVHFYLERVYPKMKFYGIFNINNRCHRRRTFEIMTKRLGI